MSALIVWASILGYFAIGAAMHSRFAICQYNASRDRGYAVDSPAEAAGYAALQSLIWPAYFLIWRSTTAINKNIELEEEMKKVRRQIAEERETERRRAQTELAAFDRAMKEKS